MTRAELARALGTTEPALAKLIAVLDHEHSAARDWAVFELGHCVEWYERGIRNMASDGIGPEHELIGFYAGHLFACAERALDSGLPRDRVRAMLGKSPSVDAADRLQP